MLGIASGLISEHGAVSKQVALAMAEGARLNAKTNFALATTGIAGPSGGTEGKPVGTVFIGLAGPGRPVVVRNINPWDRLTFKRVTAQQALELLRRKLVLE